MVNYDEWFLAEVDKGLAQIESGQTLSHEEVGARLDEIPYPKTIARLMQLRWTEEAEADLRRIADYLFEHAQEHAPAHRAGYLRRCGGLADFSGPWKTG